MSVQVRLLHLDFDLPLRQAQARHWRGAFAKLAGWDNDLLHNHQSAEAYHYRYPLVQYRARRGRASITAFNEGVEALQAVLSKGELRINWREQALGIKIEDIHLVQHQLACLPEPRRYRIRHWLALNQENYQRWQQQPGLAQRAALLEQVLVGQLLGFCTAMGYELPERLEVSILDLERTLKVSLHGNPMLALDVAFAANLSLPQGLGLGRGVSTGYGVVLAV